MAASLEGWSKLAPALATLGRNVFALDLPGHGDSIKPTQAAEYHIEEVYAHLENWMEELNLQEPALIVGHSLGGYLGFLYTLRNPGKVASQILIDPFYSKRQLFPFMRLTTKQPKISATIFKSTPAWALRSLLTFVRNISVDIQSPDFRQMLVDFRRATPQILHIAPSMDDLSPCFPKIRVPTLVLWGQNDLTLAPTSFPAVIEGIPMATGQALPDCGHTPHLSHPELVIELIVGFLTLREEYPGDGTPGHPPS
jgi:pimeloyl-ACP methyl ester carboxylesterase